LEKYLNEIKRKFKESKILPIYFKTGDQSNYAPIIKNGYKIYLRKDFLVVLDHPFENDILNDYKTHLLKIEDAINSYKTVHIDEWSNSAIKGFYIALKEKLNDGNWNYVANPSGGFFGFWWKNYQLNGYRIYMQIDAIKKKDVPLSMQLKFKLASGTKEKVDRNTINKWKKYITYNDDVFIINKPRVVRAGRWTTVGILDGDFRVTDENGNVDLSKTVDNIKKIEQILSKKLENMEVD